MNCHLYFKIIIVNFYLSFINLKKNYYSSLIVKFQTYLFKNFLFISYFPHYFKPQMKNYL